MGNSAIEPLLILAICAVAAVAFIWLRRRGLLHIATAVQSGSKPLKVVSRLALTQQHSLHLVRFGEETILLAASPSGCQLLQTRRSGE
jgi:flagellar biogenesis protein FliO